MAKGKVNYQEVYGLLNNRNFDKSALKQSEYDGSDKNDNKADGNETGDNASSDNASVQSNKPSRRKETAPRAGKTRLKVDKMVVHEVDEYYTLPEGGRFMNRNGIPDVWECRVIEHVRAHNVEHVYKVARVNGGKSSDAAMAFLEYLWKPYPLTDIRFTGYLTEKTQRCFIYDVGRTTEGCGLMPYLRTGRRWI